MCDSPSRSLTVSSRAQTGFTLVEIIVGIVVSAIALTFMTTLFFANPSRSVEPILQIRAAEFGQALMDEILAKRFDEATPLGGVPACSALTIACTAEAGFGPDGAETRDQFDDVDDYHTYCGAPGDLIDAQGNNLSNTSQPSAVGHPFPNYQMEVCVYYDGDFSGALSDGDTRAKFIEVEITAPSGSGLGAPIVFHAYRGNF